MGGDGCAVPCHVGLGLSWAAWFRCAGALARFAVPGPDPMPMWLTIAIGLVGWVKGDPPRWRFFALLLLLALGTVVGVWRLQG